jgi:NAD(P)-dependent dehydrogenase (short-subunit alcohol dehydrogenase family)
MQDPDIMSQATQPGLTRPTVLVTGASGYIAGWIIRYLLEEGYTVHATVRDPNKAVQRRSSAQDGGKQPRRPQTVQGRPAGQGQPSPPRWKVAIL